MKKTRILGIIAILLLIGIGSASMSAYSSNMQKSTHGEHDSEQGLTNDDIRDGLINHGVNHKESEN